MTDAAGPPSGEERRTGERRRYNRRRPEDAVTPPYYEAFERIAVALEDIRDQLATRTQISLPKDPVTAPPPPRGSGRGG